MGKCTTSLCPSKEVGIKWLADQELRSLICLRMGRKTRPTILFKFRFAVADQYWRSTDSLPVPWWCLQCQMRWSTRRPVSNSIQLQAETWKQSAATGILNGLALDYLSTIIPVVGLDITFFIAHLCVARSVWHWEPWACLAHWRRIDRSPRTSQSPNQLRNLTYELPDGDILSCRQTLLMRRTVPHDTELKSIGAQIDFGI